RLEPAGKLVLELDALEIGEAGYGLIGQVHRSLVKVVIDAEVEADLRGKVLDLPLVQERHYVSGLPVDAQGGDVDLLIGRPDRAAIDVGDQADDDRRQSQRD